MGGAMTWVSERHLVAAISNAGGFGVIASRLHDAGSAARREIAATAGADRQAVRRQPDHHASRSSLELIDVCLEHRVGHVVLAGGLPPRRRHRSGSSDGGAKRDLLRAGAGRWRKKLVRIGADAIVIEGMEAGGHIGPVSTSGAGAGDPAARSATCRSLSPAASAAARRSLAYLEMGAAGVQLGTRFVCADESIAHPQLQAGLHPRRGARCDAVGPARPALSGHPGARARQCRRPSASSRCSAASSTASTAASSTQKDAQLEIEHFWAGALRRAVIDGDVETGSLMAGPERRHGHARAAAPPRSSSELVDQARRGAARRARARAAERAEPPAD